MGKEIYSAIKARATRDQIEALLKDGKDPNESAKKRGGIKVYVLYYALTKGRDDIARLLIENGADYNLGTVGEEDFFPGEWEITSAKDYAIATNNTEILKLIEQKEKEKREIKQARERKLQGERREMIQEERARMDILKKWRQKAIKFYFQERVPKEYVDILVNKLAEFTDGQSELWDEPIDGPVFCEKARLAIKTLEIATGERFCRRISVGYTPEMS